MKFTAFIKSTLLGGFIFLVPLTVLVIVLRKAFEFAHRLSAPVLNKLPEMQFGGVALATLLTAGILVLICFLAGLAAKVSSTNKFSTWLDENVLCFIPGYTMFRSMSFSFSEKDKTRSFPVVLARIEDSAWQMGFLIEKLDTGDLVIYAPDAPNPFSGGIYYLPANRVKELNVEMNTALKSIRRMGLGSKELLKNISL